MPFDFTVYCQYPLCDAVLDEDWKQFCVFHFKEDMAAIESGTDDRNFPMKKWFYQLQGGLCNYCGQHFSIDRLNWEHMKPGGSNAKSNLQLACEPCNRKKYIRTDRKFREENAGLLPGKPRQSCSPPIDSGRLRGVNWRTQFRRRR